MPDENRIAAMSKDEAFATFTLQDDGTLDTVFRCDDCGAEERFSFQNSGTEEEGPEAYNAFVEELLDSLRAEHECEVA